MKIVNLLEFHGVHLKNLLRLNLNLVISLQNSFHVMDLRQMKFIDTLIRDCGFEECNLEKSLFDNCDLEQTIFIKK